MYIFFAILWVVMAKLVMLSISNSLNLSTNLSDIMPLLVINDSIDAKKKANNLMCSKSAAEITILAALLHVRWLHLAHS